MARKQRVAVLEILSLPENWLHSRLVARHYAGVFPQAVAVWCAGAGFDVTYRTYFGCGAGVT